MENVYLECGCNSTEHIAKFSYIENSPTELYLEIHLSNQSFFKRIWSAFKYIIGHKSVYGDFDCMILTINSIKKMQKEFNTFLEKNKNYTNKKDYIEKVKNT